MANWYNSNWNTRRIINLSPTTPSPDYQVKIVITSTTLTGAQLTAGNANGNDIRFTHSDGTTLQDYWIESWTSSGTSVTATIRVRVATPGTSSIYMYYGNPTAISSSNSAIMATGGMITDIPWYRIHTFTISGTFTPTSTMNVEYLVVAGGGGGGGASAGGGGAGGLLYGTGYQVTIQGYAITVGNGGTGAFSPTSGSNSIFDTLVAIGGGGGHLSGGSGGGGSYSTSAGSGTAGQGNNGGAGRTGSGNACSGNAYSSGGGGGAGAVGQNGSASKSGDGGVGLSSSITGTSVMYAGGGGGGADSYRCTTQGIGGLGGGGNGGYNAVGTAGTANTGGGGGGGSNNYSNFIGGNGGSGIVIIRYSIGSGTLASEEPNITATNMIITPSETPCSAGSCTLSVSVTWTNNGSISGDFVPNITIDGTPAAPSYPSEPLATGTSVTRSFVVSSLTAKTYTICPFPN